MLTGDNTATAQTIAQQAGIDDARGNLLPEDKLAAIEELQKRYGPTAMTGDGINDAPALARADIGIAMGAAGTDTAMEAADVVIMNDDLRRIPETIRLSRRTRPCCGRTSSWPWASRRSSWCWPSSATPPCGWRSSPTWVRACSWCSTGCACCELAGLEKGHDDVALACPSGVGPGGRRKGTTPSFAVNQWAGEANGHRPVSPVPLPGC